MPNKDKTNLLAIVDAIDKINHYVVPFHEADALFNDTLRFDAVMMNFVVIGEMVERLSDEFKDDHQQIDWSKVKGLRNLIAHDYFGVDAEEIWQILQQDLPKLKAEITIILSLTAP